jgi:CheY-like chemotaxis protein
MSVPLRVLILEDRATDAELMLHELRRAGFSPDWKLVETEAEYLAHLEPAPDVILADYSLPQFDAQRALELLQSRGLDIPFLIVSGNIGEEIAVSAMRRGADDYVLKDRLARLGQAVSNALALRRQRQEKQQAEATLRERDDRFRAPFQQAAVGMALVGLDGRWLMVNQSLCDSLGYSRPELSTRTCKENIHPDDLSADQGSMTLLLAGGHSERLAGAALSAPRRNIYLVQSDAVAAAEFLGPPGELYHGRGRYPRT